MHPLGFHLVLACVEFVALLTEALAFKDYEVISLKTHNVYRSRHLNTPPMKLDSDLNRRAQLCAQHYAQKGHIDHSCPKKAGAGENLYLISGGTVSKAVAAKAGATTFYNEIKFYDFHKPAFTLKSGHFTQLIWKSSSKLGVGIVEDKKKRKMFLVNLYRENGNINTQAAFNENVQPLRSLPRSKKSQVDSKAASNKNVQRPPRPITKRRL